MLQLKSFFLIILTVSPLLAQLDLKRDDYVGTTNRNWWRWYNDGPSTPTPAVSDGYVLFSLIDPVANFDPFCDAAIWDGYPSLGGPYLYCTVTVRAKALNPHKFGSRGWGLWYTEPLPNLQRQAWFMHVLDSAGVGYTGLDWWRAETSNGRTEATHHFTELDTIPIDDEQWHVYEIIRDTTFIEMKVDGNRVLYTEEDLPTEDLAFHIWVDNLVYEHVEPDIINVYKREWTGQNDIVLDYVQILTPEGQLDKSESASGIKLLRQVPNEIFTQESAGLWNSYNFSSPGGQIVTLVTARVEQYLDASEIAISGDDDIRLIIDGNDYGWNTANSFNGDAQGTVSKTLVFEQTMTSGTKGISVYGETSPLLYDVTVLGSGGGGIVFNQEYNETKPALSDSLWKEINFQTWGGDVALYISGSADEDPNPSRYGYQYSDFDNNSDDDIRIQLDGTSYGYSTDNSFWGNRLFGEPKSVLIIENLSKGGHTLRLYGQGTPVLYRVLIYGENDDTPLPVTLYSFEIVQEQQANIIKWETASEVNNLGFNIYRAVSQRQVGDLRMLAFAKLNDDIIPGAGSCSHSNEYDYVDKNVINNNFYWYYLEDVSYNGLITHHDTLSIERIMFDNSVLPSKFNLSQNYPNPFNGITKIDLSVSIETHIQLEIINVLGERVRVLANKLHNPGLYSYFWNGKDELGETVGSGVYFYRTITTSGVTAVKKLLFLK